MSSPVHIRKPWPRSSNPNDLGNVSTTRLEWLRISPSFASASIEAVRCAGSHFCGCSFHASSTVRRV